MHYSFFDKWNLYQKTRFPVFKNSLLILAFSSSAVCYSSMTSGRFTIDFLSCFVAFITCILFFLQLRIADEFKDYEEDCLYRSYRPVPQGIIKLKELKYLFIISCFIQLGAATLISLKLVPLLLIVWVYLSLMSHEFGVKKWLKAHPVVYLLSHMLIMPMVDFYATATDWINFSAPSHSLYWFIVLSFFNGINLEIGRKIRRPQDEETGVETYSFLWGRKKAITVWILMILATGLCAIGASFYLPKPVIFIVTTFVVLYVSTVIFYALDFLKRPHIIDGKVFENLSGIFTLCVYLLLGIIPFICS